MTDAPRHALDPSDPTSLVHSDAPPRHQAGAEDPEGGPVPQPEQAHAPEADEADPARSAPDPTPTPPPAVVSARRLGVKTHDPAFSDLDVEIPAGRFAAVVGPAGCGKSTLLLALTGRLRPVVGELSVGGLDAMKHPGKVRAATAIARLGDLIHPEKSLTLDDCLTERTLFDAADPKTREANYLHAARLLGLDAHRGTLFGDLTPLDRTRAALALACVRPSTVIVLDDLDDNVTVEEQRALWDGVAALAADGQPVIAATTEPSAVHPDAVVIDLEPEA